MACPQCLRDPFSHSFDYFGKTEKGESLYYTAPARATARDTNYSYQSMRVHLNAIQGPWIWVLDCANMELHTMYTMWFANAITEILMQEHSKQLRRVLIVNPNGWIYRILHKLHPDILDCVQICTKGILLNNACTDLAFTSAAKTWLLLAFTKDPNHALDAPV